MNDGHPHQKIEKCSMNGKSNKVGFFLTCELNNDSELISFTNHKISKQIIPTSVNLIQIE